MNTKQANILAKSALNWQLGRTGWIAYSGGELPLASDLVNEINHLKALGYVETDLVWGMLWYRVRITELINKLECL